MEIKLKTGIDQLLFGMRRADVEKLYGKPDKIFNDEDQNVIHVYNDRRLRLTYYQDEDFKLGFFISAHPELELFGMKIIGADTNEVKSFLESIRIKSWEREDFDMAENLFNEENWLILQSEFGKVMKVEVGAIINNKDEFDWKFK